MTTNPPPDARNARIYVATANVAVMDILSGREQPRSLHDTPPPDDPLLADERFRWLLGLAFGDGSLSRQRANRAYLCLLGDLREETQDRPVNFRGKRGIPNAKHGLHLHNELLASGCTGMRSPVTAFRSRAPSAGCRANPSGDGDLAASQLTVSPTVRRSPYAGSQDAHHLGQPLTQPIVFPGGQIHRVAGPNPAGLREAAYSDAPPLYASEGAKRTEHPRVCTLPPA